jgi:mRNA-degrading endonuclease RelE of RelBE toxin-antitoxin system
MARRFEIRLGEEAQRALDRMRAFDRTFWELRVGIWRVLCRVEADVLIVTIVRKGRKALGEVL